VALKKVLTGLFCFLALLFSSLPKYGPDNPEFSIYSYLHYQFSIGLAFCCIPIAIYLGKRLGFLFGVLAGYVGIYSMCLSMNLHGRYFKFPFELGNAVSIATTYTFLTCTILLFGVLHTPRKWRKLMRVAIPTYTVANSLYVVKNFAGGFLLFGGNGYSGFLNYSGMNGTQIALGCAFLIPLATDTKAQRYLRYLGLLISLTAIILSKSAIPFGVFGIVVAARYIHQGRGLFYLAGALALGGVCVGPKMLSSSERFTAYKIFMGYLWEKKRMLLGEGLGTLSVYAPTIQFENKFMVWEEAGRIKGWVWSWLHSDFIQSFFELGAIGFVLIMLIYLQALMRSKVTNRDWEIFSLGVGLGGAALLNYPCRYFSTAFLVTYFLVEALERKSPSPFENQDLLRLPKELS
jgi:hypothetical protein